MSKVTFAGASYTIYISSGITEIDAQIDLYSDWKEWAVASANAKYHPAFIESVGGNDIGGGFAVGDYYFFNNDYWKIQPYDGDHILNVTENLYPANTSAAMFNNVSGRTVTIQLERSQLTQIANVSTGSGLDTTQNNMLTDVFKVLGLDSTDYLIVKPTRRYTQSSSISQSIGGDAETSVTVARL